MYVGRRINSIIDLMSQHATLLTSDINLTRDVACDMLDHFGTRRKKSISVVQVPHHGSRDYWSPENASYICPVCHRVPVDNNRCEQMMRPVAQGRRSWLFAGSGRRADGGTTDRAWGRESPGSCCSCSNACLYKNRRRKLRLANKFS